MVGVFTGRENSWSLILCQFACALGCDIVSFANTDHVFDGQQAVNRSMHQSMPNPIKVQRLGHLLSMPLVMFVMLTAHTEQRRHMMLLPWSLEVGTLPCCANPRASTLVDIGSTCCHADGANKSSRDAGSSQLPVALTDSENQFCQAEGTQRSSSSRSTERRTLGCAAEQHPLQR